MQVRWRNGIHAGDIDDFSASLLDHRRRALESGKSLTLRFLHVAAGDYEAGWVVVRERAEQDRVGDAENRGRGADSQGDGDGGGEGEDGALPEGAGSVEEISGEHVCD